LPPRVFLEDYSLKQSRGRKACSHCSLNLNCPGECPSRLYYNRHDGVQLACVMYQTLARTLKPERP
jgi:uncharacterized protein